MVDTSASISKWLSSWGSKYNCQALERKPLWTTAQWTPGLTSCCNLGQSHDTKLTRRNLHSIVTPGDIAACGSLHLCFFVVHFLPLAPCLQSAQSSALPHLSLLTVSSVLTYLLSFINLDFFLHWLGLAFSFLLWSPFLTLYTPPTSTLAFSEGIKQPQKAFCTPSPLRFLFVSSSQIHTGTNVFVRKHLYLIPVTKKLLKISCIFLGIASFTSDGQAQR